MSAAPGYALAPYFTMLAARYTTVLLIFGYLFTGSLWVAASTLVAAVMALGLYIALKHKSEWGRERVHAVSMHLVLVAVAGLLLAHAIWAEA